ncbi:MAG: methylisocitrate lyase [Phycisphaerae bacterium]|nr:methylisocitrate lyase [Tepidisphaeraceae bacterium]
MTVSRSSQTPGAAFRRLVARQCVAMPGAYNALTARQIAAAGFKAVYVSGAGLANATAGVPDIGLLSREEVAQLAGYVAAAVPVPVIADADTGFDDVAKTVRSFEAAGLAGLHVEDQVFPKRCGHLAGKEVVSEREMARKIRTAVKVRRDPEFVIIARTDARAVEGFDGAVERAKAYLAAGADAIFPEALETADEFMAFAKAIGAPRVKLMANMTEFGRGPLLSVSELSKMGYRMVIFPQTALRAGQKAQADCLAELAKTGSQKKWLGKMQTRAELYELLEYEPSKEWELAAMTQRRNGREKPKQV